MRKVIIITAILLAIGITAALIFIPRAPVNTLDNEPDKLQENDDNTDRKTGKVKIETPSADEVFYIENEALRLLDYPQYVNEIGPNSEGYFGVIGFSEYPLVIKKDVIKSFDDFPEVMSNSDGTAFLAYAFVGEERVLYYGKDGEIRKISEPNIQDAVLLSDGEEIAWLSGEDDSNNCTVKVLKDDEITVLTRDAASYYGAYLLGSTAGSSLIWYENFKQEEWTYETSFTVILYKDGKTAPIGKDIELKGYSGNAEKIFYEDKGKFYVQNGFDKENRVFIADYSPFTGSQNAAYAENLSGINYAQSDLSTMGLYNQSTESFGAISLSQPDITTMGFIASNYDDSQVIIYVSNLLGEFKSVYYEEGKEPKELIDEILTAVYPEDGTGVDDLSEYYYTTENYDSGYNYGTHNVYCFDGAELKPVLDFGVRSLKTFTKTDNFLYETEENLWLYDSATGESVSVYEFEKSSDISYTATPDLSKIYVEASSEGVSVYYLDEVKPDGSKTRIINKAENSYLDGETFYYLTPEKDLYIYENGNSEKVFSFGEYNIGWISFHGRNSGYSVLEVHRVSGDDDDFAGIIYFLSTDGRNFVCVEDYLK